MSLDGGSQANITTLPAYTNGQWVFQFTSGETTGKSIRVVVVDSATKAVEDQFFVIETFGHASAMFVVDFTDSVRFGLTALPAVAAGAAGGLPTFGTGAGQINPSGGKVPSTLAGSDMTGNPPPDWLNAAAVKADAVAKIQSGLSTYDGSDTSGTSAILALAGGASGFAAIKADSAAILALAGSSGVVVASASKTGYSLAAAGLDAIPIETGVNLRQAISPILAAAAGVLMGAGTGTIVIKGGNVATTRITATTDDDGNRSSVTISLPA